MHYLRTLSISLLALSGLVGAVAADEPFSIKHELRYGPVGPKHAAVAVPGENVFMLVRLTGRGVVDSDEVHMECRTEVRSDSNELLRATSKRQATLRKLKELEQCTFTGGFSVPKDYEGDTIKLILIVQEMNSGVEAKDELTVKIARPKSPHAFNIAYFSQSQSDEPVSGKFTVGDKIRVRFVVGQIKDTKAVECKIEFIPSCKSSKYDEMQFAAEIPQANRVENRLPLKFDFPADEPFEGKIRLTVVDDAKVSNSVELPLVISEALGAEDAAYVAETPKKSADEPKKE